MNCMSCNAPLKPGARFCTQCGTKQQEVTVNAKDGASAETPVAAQENSGNISMVKQKIFWNIQPGEVARRINEAEFIQYETAQGIIVNDGTVAYIKCNGALIAEVHGGNYDFISPDELNKLLETRIGSSVASAFRGAGRIVANFFAGKQVKDNLIKEQSESLKGLKSLDEVLEYMKRGDLFSIMLKQEREFQLLIGGMHDHPDTFANFVPMKVRTGFHDVEMGIRAFFRINDFDAFSTYYLTEANVVRTNLLAQELTPIVRSVLEECLRDVELKDNRIPEDVYSLVNTRLKAINLHGLMLNNIIEITVDNEDMERMRGLAKELYLSEQELDYLHRTNDFKNRLAAVNIGQAHTDLDLFRQLQEINKDEVLTKDELEKFYIVLSRERHIFEAQEKDKAEAAMAEIAQTGLLRKEELEILEFQIKERGYKRGFAVKLMQLHDAIEYEKVRTGGEQAVELQAMAHKLELVRTQDAHSDERFYKELERRTAVADAELDHLRKRTQIQNDRVEFAFNLAERERQAQMERISQMERLDSELEDKASERRQKEKQQELEHELQMQREKDATEKVRIDAHQHMSAEQIMAQQAAGLDAAAQAELARTLAAGKNEQKEKELRKEHQEFMNQQFEAQQRNHERNTEDMKEVMQSALNSMATVSGNMVQNRNEQKEEYRSELHREQDRHDRHQDRALNYTTRPQQSNAGQPQQGYIQPQQPQTPVSPKAKGDEGKECGQCKKQYDVRERFCEECGCEL